jgi:membrane associated rhomboid family serine protease
MNIDYNPQAELDKFKKGLIFALSFAALIWLVKMVEWILAIDFGILGILPRSFSGILGIFTAPLIHGDFTHLLSNTFPLVLLTIGLFYFYNRIATEVIFVIYFMTGIWVWLSAREAYHIGASGVIYGLVSFLFFSGMFRKDIKSMAVSVVVVFLYGGMIYGILPTSRGISWESHLLGSVAGLFAAFYYRKKENPRIQDIIEGEVEEDILNSSDENVTTFTQTASSGLTQHFVYRYKASSDTNKIIINSALLNNQLTFKNSEKKLENDEEKENPLIKKYINKHY